ncbi:AAA family ATPase [Clostridium sp. DL1XJH146]
MSKEIILKSLSIKNFKGIKNSAIIFGKVTNIYGENGTGKTTIQDAFSFLLFDKDSKDSTKFDVQPLNVNNEPIHNLETVIEATLNVDSRNVVLKRVYKEKYSKVRGTSRTEFKGYESKYYVNEVPQKVTEYKKYISDLLDEKLFKLITNPIYFANLAWKDRREIITEIVGDMDYKDVIESKKDLKPLLKYLEDKTVDDFIKANKSKISQLKKDRAQIPSRIDEVNNSIQELDFKSLETEKKYVLDKIEKLDEQLQDKSKINEELYKFKENLIQKKHQLSNMEYALQSDLEKPKREIEMRLRTAESENRMYENDLGILEREVIQYKDALNKLNVQITDLRENYKKIKSSSFEFDEENCVCPTCGRKYDTENIEKEREEAEKKFNFKKAHSLKNNATQGKEIKERIAKGNETVERKEKAITDKKKQIEETMVCVNQLKSELVGFKPNDINDTPEILKAKKEIEKLERKINKFKTDDLSELKDKKRELQEIAREFDKQLAYQEINTSSKARIKELSEEEANLSQKIAELEGLEILSEDFIRTKVELLEEKVNSKFKIVKFKMFRNQINGGLEECCEPCVNGVPFTSNLNTAAKMNAGLDIINTLCSHYEVQAPIFIDNREAVNQIIDVNSQVINLVVSKDKDLKVKVEAI